VSARGDGLLSVLETIESIIEMRNARQGDGEGLLLSYAREDIVTDLKRRKEKKTNAAQALLEGGFAWDEDSNSFVLAFRERQALTAEERQSREAAVRLVEARLTTVPWAVREVTLAKSPQARTAGRFYDRIEIRLEGSCAEPARVAEHLNSMLLPATTAAPTAPPSKPPVDPSLVAWRVLDQAGVLRDGVEEARLKSALQDLVAALEKFFMENHRT
jgi:hypothetical protein